MLIHQQLENHVGLSNVVTDSLVLKHQTISIYRAVWLFILDQFRKYYVDGEN